MYPQPELSRGVARKAAVRRRIALRRAQCVVAATQAVQSLVLLERMVTLWRQLAPFAGIAALVLSFRRKRAASPRHGLIRRMLRWAPMLLGALRLVSATGRRRDRIHRIRAN